MLVTSAAEFRSAVDAYPFDPVRFEPSALALARASIEQAGMLVVGEPHGVAETPAVLYALALELDTRALALEWSHDELGRLAESSDIEGFWALPPTAEFFSGDGRFTAGHFALIERLREEGRLDQLILFDRLDPVPQPEDWRIRDREMAERLLSEWSGAPLLALMGGFHASLEPGTMADHLAKARPKLRPAMLVYEGPTEVPETPVRFDLPAGTPAVLPQSREGVET